MLLPVIEIDIFNLVLENAKVSIKYKGNIKLVIYLMLFVFLFLRFLFYYRVINKTKVTYIIIIIFNRFLILHNLKIINFII